MLLTTTTTVLHSSWAQRSKLTLTLGSTFKESSRHSLWWWSGMVSRSLVISRSFTKYRCVRGGSSEDAWDAGGYSSVLLVIMVDILTSVCLSEGQLRLGGRAMLICSAGEEEQHSVLKWRLEDITQPTCVLHGVCVCVCVFTPVRRPYYWGVVDFFYFSFLLELRCEWTLTSPKWHLGC